MTRVVVLNHFPVWPAQSGGQQAVLGLAAELAAHWPVELVWTERKTARSMAVEVAGRRLQATAVPNRWLQRQAGRWLRRPLGRVDTEVASLLLCAGNRALLRHLRGALQDGDVLLLAHPWLWPAVQRLRRERRVRLVFDAHNIEHEMKRQVLADTPLARRVIERVRQAEAQLVQHSDLVLACTRRDADALAALAGPGGLDAARLLVGSKGIAPSAAADAMAAARAARPAGRCALFIGADHPPNNEAARWILQVLAPACPDWRFVVAGACGPAAGAAVPPNARVTGRVDDLGPLLAEADVALNPIVAGSGINMKLFEYLQHGLPVLSTPFGARGFEGLAATGLLTAERDAFAATLGTLAADGAALARLRAEGPRCVHAHFEWPVVGARVAARIAALR